MKKRTILKMGTIVLVSALLALPSCIKEDRFGLSSFKEIKAFELPSQAGVTVLNATERTIEIPMAQGVDVSKLQPTRLEISNLATVYPPQSQVQDFTVPVIYKVTAEDGSIAEWTVRVVPATPNSQLPNSNFNQWYAVGSYMQPGENKETTIWGTANRAMAISGSANTIPVDLGGGDFAAKMTSVAAPLLVRMAAATLFTGSFTEGFPSPSDPRSNINFGTPFSGRPASFRVDYKYIPGASYEDANGNVLPGTDHCDMYVLLQHRNGGVTERIGTGWFRDNTQVTNWNNVEVNIKYGQLTPADPEFAYANVRTDEGEVWGDPNKTPTHIVVVFSSSALGDSFTGAIGSELWVNNFELNY